MTEKWNFVAAAMRHKEIVLLICAILIGVGCVGLMRMQKNEFPDFTIRQGVVIAVYPGATASEVTERVTKPLENYIFSYSEVLKRKTHSISRDGMAIVQVELNPDFNDKDAFWSKFKHGVNQFKSNLPGGVLALIVLDDFGEASSLLISMESKDKTLRELNDYMKTLQDRLRTIESIGRMNVYGMQKDQISIELDHAKLAHYAINEKILAMNLMSKNFLTTSGTLKDGSYESPMYVKSGVNSVKDIEETIVFTSPAGDVVRLKDIANVRQEYAEPASYITQNDHRALILSVEMKKGRNIVQMGKDINKVLSAYKAELPGDVKIFKITDQSEVVDSSVRTFLRELLISIAAVILVVMLLLPLKVALVSALTIPISIFISLALFFVFKMELNTVTLAALIVTLGMIVDNSIVIIDNYMEKINRGGSRWGASVHSAMHFFRSIFSATLAVSITFFPLIFTLQGTYSDFVYTFPFAMSIILGVSLAVAVLLVPFLQFAFLKKAKESRFSIPEKIQKIYDKLLCPVFRHPYIVVLISLACIIWGAHAMINAPMKLLPTAQRNQFSVEIYMPTGTSLKKTALVADSLERILRKDSRTVSITSFKGTASPRFHTAYAPQFGGPNFAQFVVNTTGVNATEEMIREYAEKYADYFPEGWVRFKQLSFSQAPAPLEVRLQGENSAALKRAAEKVKEEIQKIPECYLVRSSLNEPLAGIAIELSPDASKYGITPFEVETAMALRYSTGIPVATIWNGDKDIPVMLRGAKADSAGIKDVENEMLPIYGGLQNVRLNTVARVNTVWNEGELRRRNGIPTVIISAEVDKNHSATSIANAINKKLPAWISDKRISYELGGEYEESTEEMPRIISGLVLSVGIIFLILLWHFKNIRSAIIILCSLTLCVFGTGFALWATHQDFSITCVLGVVSLMGISVRNGIIMIDYAEEIRKKNKLSFREAAVISASRRMRPIFLTSAAASMGVIPMILGKSSLWMPMGIVIFFGTLITMCFILTVFPIMYWKANSALEYIGGKKHA